MSEREALREAIEAMPAIATKGQHAYCLSRAAVLATLASPGPEPVREAITATVDLPEDAPDKWRQRDIYAAGWGDRGDAIRQWSDDRALRLSPGPEPVALRIVRVEVAAVAVALCRNHGHVGLGSLTCDIGRDEAQAVIEYARLASPGPEPVAYPVAYSDPPLDAIRAAVLDEVRVKVNALPPHGTMADAIDKVDVLGILTLLASPGPTP